MAANPRLEKIIKLTQSQYNSLSNGGTVGSYTGLNDNYLYLIQDTAEYALSGHTHGNITNSGKLTTDLASGDNIGGILVVDGTVGENKDKIVRVTNAATLRSYIGAGTSSLTLVSSGNDNGTNTTAARSDHKHSISLDKTGISTIDLLSNATYTLTAGGKSVTFKTPVDNNTTLSGLAYCTTSASTAAKTATMPRFALSSGQRILLWMDVANTVAGSVTLNINGTGAKPVKIGSANPTAVNFVNGLWIAYYDGTNWNLTSSAGKQGFITADSQTFYGEKIFNSVNTTMNKAILKQRLVIYGDDETDSKPTDNTGFSDLDTVYCNTGIILRDSNGDENDYYSLSFPAANGTFVVGSYNGTTGVLTLRC